MASKIKVDQLETADGTGTIALQNQLSGMTTASLPALGSAQMPTGSVLQVVQGTMLAGIGSSSTTWAATGLDATITPISSSSKILVMAGGWLNVPANLNHGVLTLYRGSTDLGPAYGFGNFYTASGGYTESMASFNYLDSPSTTSATEYEVYLRRGAGSGTVEFGSSVRLSTIILMEIAG